MRGWRRRYGVMAVVVVAAAIGVPVALGRTHVIHNRLVIGAPPPHKTSVTNRRVRVPRGTKEFAVVMQFPRPGGGYSKAIPPDEAIDYRSKDGKHLLRVWLRVAADNKHHRVHYAIVVKNLNVSRQDYRHTSFDVVVSVAYPDRS